MDWSPLILLRHLLHLLTPSHHYVSGHRSPDLLPPALTLRYSQKQNQNTLSSWKSIAYLMMKSARFNLHFYEAVKFVLYQISNDFTLSFAIFINAHKCFCGEKATARFRRVVSPPRQKKKSFIHRENIAQKHQHPHQYRSRGGGDSH